MIPVPAIPEYGHYLNIATADTTVVKSITGVLLQLVVNGGTLGAITIYDNASAGSGTKIATIALPVAGMILPYGCIFGNGLTIVTAANTDITVTYA